MFHYKYYGNSIERALLLPACIQWLMNTWHGQLVTSLYLYCCDKALPAM